MASTLLLTARDLAERAHRGQTRKALGQPYFSHLEAVAGILSAHGYTDEITLAAAYLHDLVEDQSAYTQEMKDVMPAAVVDTVLALTEPKRDANGAPKPKADRFDAYVQGLGAQTEATRRALPISCADKIHNALSIVEAETRGERLLMSLKTRPGDHRHQLARLRGLYAGAVDAALLSTYDDAARTLHDFIEAWFPGRAAMIAAEAHLGQFDKAGAPYFFHPMHLAAAARETDERTAALLHDVVEDTPWTLEALSREGCPERVLRALDALTRRKGESYEAFIERIAKDRLATRVKLLDLAHNSDLSRLAAPTDADRERVEKYRRSSARLRRELEKRNLYVRLTPESVAAARARAVLPVARAEHVTLAHRIHPEELDASVIPGGRNLGDTVQVHVVAEAADEHVQVFGVEIEGTRTRPFDGGVLHLTVSRGARARSRDANDLLARGVAAPPTGAVLVLHGVVELVDE
jgi:hypothetical protein